MTTLPLNMQLARHVQAVSLEPHQQPTEKKFKTSTDFYQQYMIKHPFLSEFHSYFELLHAGLLEGDPTIISYVPQPYMLRVYKRRYKPDCYVLSDGEQRRVVELRPEGKKKAENEQLALVAFFAQYRMVFEIISNESIFERETEALNWLEIVRILHQARTFITTDAEHRVVEKLRVNGPCTLGDLIDAGDRERTYLLEIALFRLLHRGLIQADLSATALDYDLGLELTQ